MKKRVKIATVIRRCILFTLLGLVILFVVVFFVDTYKESTVDAINKYSDDYWDQEVLEGFTYYTDFIDRQNKYDYGNEAYEYPWVKDGFKTSDLTEIEQVDYGRYIEEVDKIMSPLTSEKTKKQANAKYRAEKAFFEYKDTPEDLIENLFYCDPEDLTTVEFTGTVLEYVNSLGFEDSEEELIDIIRCSNKADDILESLDENGIDVYDEEVLNKLCKGILVDTEFYNALTTYSDEVIEISERLEFIQEIEDHATEKKQSLVKWDEYKKQIFSFGGIATDTPNAPSISIDNEDGSKYNLYLDYLTTGIKLEEVNASGDVVQSWLSLPDQSITESDYIENFTTNNEVKTLQKSPLIVYYSGYKGNVVSYTTYEYSITDTDLNNGSKITPSFAFKVDDENNTVIVYYHLEKRGISNHDFPQYITQSKMQELFARNAAKVDNGEDVPDLRIADATDVEHYDESNPNFKLVKEARQRLLQGYYNLVKTTDAGYDFHELLGENAVNYYEIDDATYKAMKLDYMRNLHTYFYDWCDYTEEDLEEDNGFFDIQITISRASFDIAIEYELTNKGLVTRIPGNSIKESEGFEITSVDILPYFTATDALTEGYTVIPDGSGMILNHNNGNINYSKYQKRVYTTDLCDTSYVNKGSYEDLMFPMYGVVNPEANSGMLVYASTVAGQLQLTADISGRTSIYNTNYFTSFIREYKEFKISLYGKTTITKWTPIKVKDDIVINYELLDSDELSYSALAKKYREALVEMFGIEEKDSTNSPVLNLDVLGTYSYQDNFIGIPYTAKDSLTTIDQLNEILDTFTSKNINNINVSYLGWRSTNMKQVSFKRMNTSNLIGSKDKFQELLAGNDSKITVYPYVDFGEYSKYQESFGKSHYTSHAADGSLANRKPYDLSSNAFDKLAKYIYALSPRYYLPFAEELVSNYERITNGANSLAIGQLGGVLTGDYRRNHIMFRNEAQTIQMQTLDYIKSQGINDLTLYAPYDYAIKYADVIKEVPYTGTKYEILDYSIPFYQLVVNGIVDYSGESINAFSEKGLTEHLMRMIETGSNLSFTFSGDSSEKLLQTDYNTYYFTEYTDWVGDVISLYNELCELGIYNGELIAHEFLSSNIYKVTYRCPDGNKVIYLNYSRNDYTAPDGTVVAAKSYAVGC